MVRAMFRQPMMHQEPALSETTVELHRAVISISGDQGDPHLCTASLAIAACHSPRLHSLMDMSIGVMIALSQHRAAGLVAGTRDCRWLNGGNGDPDVRDLWFERSARGQDGAGNRVMMVTLMILDDR